MKHENLWTVFAAASATAVVLGGAATAALAQSQTTTIIGERDLDDIRSARVAYRDLNLASARDEKILLRRVGHAARNVCTRDNIYRYDDIGFAPCVSDAKSGAKPQVALAVRRAQQLAATGTTNIPLVAIAIVAR